MGLVCCSLDGGLSFLAADTSCVDTLRLGVIGLLSLRERTCFYSVSFLRVYESIDELFDEY